MIRILYPYSIMIGCLIRYTRNLIFKAVMIVRPKNLNSLVDFFVDLSLNFELKFFLFFFTRLQFPQTALALRGTTQRQIFVKSVPVVQDFGLTQLVFIIVQFIYALFQQELLGRSRVWVIQMDQIRFIRRKGSWPSNWTFQDCAAKHLI